MSCRFRDSFKPYSSDSALDEHLSRINESSRALDARNLKRYKDESMAIGGSRDAILRASTRVGMIRVSAPRPLRGLGNLAVSSLSRSPVRSTLRERMSSSKTARGDMSPPCSFTNRSKEDFAPPTVSDFGLPSRVRNRRSVNHPCMTRSEGTVVVRCGNPAVD